MLYKTRYRRSKLCFNALLCLLLLMLMACKNGRQHLSDMAPFKHDQVLKRIREEGVLRAVVSYNSIDYFVYRGRPMGFEYEMLQELSKDLNVRLEVSVINNHDDTFDGLRSGQYDLVAKGLAITMPRRKDADFTVPLYQTAQVLVQREIGVDTPDSVYIYSILELNDKEIHVQKNSPYHRRLINITEETGDRIRIVADSVQNVEQLITKVARNEIDYTVCHENVARLNKTYYPNLDVSLQISFPQNIAWGVPIGAKQWKDYLDNWITGFKKTQKYRQLYHRYFESPRSLTRLQSEYHSISGGGISEYDAVIKRAAKQYNWDWRLIASVIYHESRFNPEAESWAGAYGLMQVLPATAEALGVENFKEPTQNIEAGIRMLNWLNDRMIESVPDSAERVKFVLASYNVGLGHVKDAQRLALKYGKRTDVWDNHVDFYLLNKSAEEYYKDPVVRWGYCHGDQPFNYVNKVIHNYMNYRNVIDE